MRYISTRGGIEPIGFNEAVMMGLARDGGLLLPETLPSVDSTKLNSWLNLPYQYLAVEILDLFTGELLVCLVQPPPGDTGAQGR